MRKIGRRQRVQDKNRVGPGAQRKNNIRNELSVVEIK